MDEHFCNFPLLVALDPLPLRSVLTSLFKCLAHSRFRLQQTGDGLVATAADVAHVGVRRVIYFSRLSQTNSLRSHQLQNDGLTPALPVASLSTLVRIQTTRGDFPPE